MSQPLDLNQLAQQIKQWGTELGFQQVGITDTDLSASEPKLQAWLDKQYHGEMEWMARHGMMRARPHELQPGTLRVISVRMNYLPANAAFAREAAKKICLARFEAFGCAGQASKIKPLSLDKMAERYAKGELNQIVR